MQSQLLMKVNRGKRQKADSIHAGLAVQQLTSAFCGIADPSAH